MSNSKKSLPPETEMPKKETKAFELGVPQIERYSRQILLQEIGSLGMEKLLQATVTVIGAGGLGCPVVQMLAASGVGNIRLIDRDVVELTNLPRQFLHYTDDIGRPKIESIQEKVVRMNPDVNLVVHKVFADKENIVGLVKGSDYVIDATDNIPTKFLINDVCVHLGIPFSIAGVVQFYGQLISVNPGTTTCYRCVFREIFPVDESMSCSGAGVLGTVPALAGILQANEAIKSILGTGRKFTDGMFSFNLLDGSFDFIKIKKNPDCAACANPADPLFQKIDYGRSLNQYDPEKSNPF